MKLSVFYDHIVQAHKQTGKSISEILKLCRSIGIEGVEMEYTLFSQDRDAICSMLSEAGLSISCFYDFFEFQKCENLSKAENMLGTASELGVFRVLFVPGALEAQEAAELSSCSTYESTSCFMDHNPSIQSMKRALSSLTAYAKKFKVTVTLEDFDGFVQPFSRMNQLLWFMKNVPNLHYTLDMGNFAFGNEDVVLAAELLKDYIVHVHCKDRALDPFVRGEFCRGLGPSPAGGGYIPIKELISKLKEWGYDGYLAIEHFGAKDQISFMRESAAFLNTCF